MVSFSAQTYSAPQVLATRKEPRLNVPTWLKQAR